MAYGQEFKEAVGAVHTIHLFRENVELMGLQGGSVESVSNRSAAASKKFSQVVDEERRREKERGNTWLDLLNHIQTQIDALEQPFKDEFGDDYVDAMAQRFLTEEEYNSVETDEERAQLMFDKYLNPDGTIKDEFKGTEAGEWVKRFHDAQPQIAKGRELAQKLTSAHAENGGNVPDEVVAEVQAELEESGYSTTVSFDEELDDSTSDQIIAEVEDAKLDHEHQTDVTSTSTLSFS